MIGRPIHVLLFAALTQAKAGRPRPPLRHTAILAEIVAFCRDDYFFSISPVTR
jgi:hypothetical protein